MKLGHLTLIGLFLTLVACTVPQKLVQSVQIHGLDAGKTMSVIQATERVMTRRMAAANVKGGIATVIPTGTNTATLTLKLPDTAAADKMTAILASPFSFDLRIELPKTGTGETADWLSTNLTGADLLWVQAVSNGGGGNAIELQFTPHGRDMLSVIFKEHVGQNLGIFVRDLLVSKMKIDKKPVSDHVIISGIPSAKVAEIFADDVNVGLKTTFSPL